MSMYHMTSSLKGDYCFFELQPNKGIGIKLAKVDRNERAFVKFLKANYGVGEYSVVIAKGGPGFKLIWRGIIDKDRFIRIRGSLSPYLLTESPVRAWHSLDSVQNVPGD